MNDHTTEKSYNSKRKRFQSPKHHSIGLSVITENKKNKTRLYHKRDALLFSLVGMPHLGINIPPNI